MMLAGIIAFVLSVMLTVHSLSGMGLAGCSAGSSCDQVTGSKWSVILGFLPVSSLSMGLYLAVLVCCAYLFFEYDPFAKKILAALCAAISAGSLWFIYIQTFKVGAFCPYCMTAHSCGILLSICCFLWLKNEQDISRKSLMPFVSAGTAAAVVFAVFQLLTTPSYRIQSGYVQDPLPVPDASVSPVVGPTDAQHTIALLYDYQCPHCRIVHSMLEEVVDNLGGQVSFVLCPSPLSPSCNPYIPAGQDRFPGSCTMAKLALSLWSHDPDLFHSFDSWMMQSERTEEECMSKAKELFPGISTDDPWTVTYLSGTLELFARTSMNGQGGIPRLVYGDSWVIPEVDDPDDLTELVRKIIASR